MAVRKWNGGVLARLVFFAVCLFVLWNMFRTEMYEVSQNGQKYIKVELRECQPDNKRGYSNIGGVSGPVDLVLTWVNGSDPSFINEMDRLDLRNKSFNAKRYRDWGTLRFALRSVERNADWFRHVFIVTNGQIPSWLNMKYHKVKLVTHAEIFQNISHLPSFNSLAIESHIHRIPGLSKHFIYMNDDFFFLNKVELKDFYTKETGFKIRFTNAKVGYCSKDCKLIFINNGICETKCNTKNCDWDGGDCESYTRGIENTFSNLLKPTTPFRGSVLYTTFVYNREFGSYERQVPAHVPYIIDKTLMSELQDRIPDEWEKTSASRLRDKRNLMYAFAYYNYLLRPQGQNPEHKKLLPVATLLTSSEDYVFFGTGNATMLEKQLISILHNKRKKFACINDHMELHDTEKENGTQKVIDSFFNTLFPNASLFERK